MITIIATPQIKKWLEENLTQFQVSTDNKSITHCYEKTTSKNEHFKISIYTTGTLTIDGNIKERIYQKLLQVSGEHNYVGCDEVGVGDFLGPTVYVSVKLTSETINKLSDLFVPIRDSKKLTDAEIMEIYAKTSPFIEHHKQVVYDFEIDGLNSIAQKVNYHHENVFNYENETIIIDLFTTINSFYKYSNELNISWTNNIILETKADNKFLCVALASIYARAIFLQEMAKLEEKYNFPLPLGAGAKPKNAAIEFIRKYSKNELATFCKTSFKTFNEID